MRFSHVVRNWVKVPDWVNLGGRSKGVRTLPISWEISLVCLGCYQGNKVVSVEVFFMRNPDCDWLHSQWGPVMRKNVTKTDIYLGSYGIHNFVFLTLLQIFVTHFGILFFINHYFLVFMFKYCTRLRVISVI